jgi:hypothetical protein
MYESVDSVSNLGGSALQTPGQMAAPQMQTRNEHVVAQPMQQVPHQASAPGPSGKNPEQSNNVPVPAGKAEKTKWADISDYHEISDWVYILVGALVVECLIIGLTRSFPTFFGKYLNLWYSRFKLSAVVADVLIVLIGFGIARYLYTEYIYPNNDWNPAYFTGSAVGVQVIHDFLFYFGIIKPIPQAKNGMMDVMKSYGDEMGAKAVGGDSAIMVLTSIAAMLLKGSSANIVIAVALASAYAIPYFLETKNEYSVLS